MAKKKAIEPIVFNSREELQQFGWLIADQIYNPEKYQKDCNHEWEYDTEDKIKYCTWCGKEELNEKYNNG